MDIFIGRSPLLGSQAAGFEEYERQRRERLPHESVDRSIFLWLAGDRVKSEESPKGISSIRPSISVQLSQNVYIINELPEAWQTPSHLIYITSDSRMPHGLGPIIKTVVRLEDQGINCLVANGDSNRIVPVGISYASPDIVNTIKEKGFNLEERHTWHIPFEKFKTQLNYANTIRGKMHEKYNIHSFGEGALNSHTLPPIML